MGWQMAGLCSSGIQFNCIDRARGDCTGKDVNDAVLPADGGRVSAGSEVGDARRHAGKNTQDSRVGRRTCLRPGRAVTPSDDVGSYVQRTCRGRVRHDLHRRLPVSTFQLRGQ